MGEGGLGIEDGEGEEEEGLEGEFVGEGGLVVEVDEVLIILDGLVGG